MVHRCILILVTLLAAGLPAHASRTVKCVFHAVVLESARSTVSEDGLEGVALRLSVIPVEQSQVIPGRRYCRGTVGSFERSFEDRTDHVVFVQSPAATSLERGMQARFVYVYSESLSFTDPSGFARGEVWMLDGVLEPE